MNSQKLIKKIEGIINLWEGMAKRTFFEAECDPSTEEREFKAITAISRMNCAEELKGVLKDFASSSGQGGK